MEPFLSDTGTCVRRQVQVTVSRACLIHPVFITCAPLLLVFLPLACDTWQLMD